MNVSLTDAILPHVDRADLHRRMTEFYARLDDVVADHRPTCWKRGVCCSFGQYGHRLYVSTPELIYFVEGRRADWLPPVSTETCPYQVDGLCTAREHRPIGCRVFFCDPAAQKWQPEVYEKALAELKALCEEMGLSYAYVEWLSALREVGKTVIVDQTPPGG